MKRIVIFLLILSVVSCERISKEKEFQKYCKGYKISDDFLQPPEIRGGENKLPFTVFSYITEKEKIETLSPCELYVLTKNEPFLSTSLNSQKAFMKEFKGKMRKMNEERKNFFKRIEKLTEDSGTYFTDFEKELISELYIISRYRLKVIRKGSYSYTVEDTPQKLNFAIRELGISKGIENITFYYMKNKEKIEMNIDGVLLYNTFYQFPDSRYQPVFKKYNTYIYKEEIEKRNAELLKETEEKRKLEEERIKKEKESTEKTESRNSSNSYQEYSSNSYSDNSSTYTLEELSSEDEDSETATQETPEEYVPKEIKKPISGGNLNFQKSERPSRPASEK